MATVSYTVSRREYLRANLKSLMLNRSWKVIIWSLVLVFFGLSLFSNPLSTDGLLFLTLATLVAAILYSLEIVLFSFVIIFVIFLFRLYRKNPLLDSEVNFSFSPENLVSQTKLAKTEFKWEYINRVWSLKNYYFIQTVQANKQIMFVPKRAFNDSQIKEFEELLIQKHLLFIKPRIPVGKRILTIMLIIIAGALLCGLTLAAISYINLRAELRPNTLVTPSPAHTSETTLHLSNESIGSGEREIAYLQNGQIWLVNVDLNKKMNYELAGVTDPITDFIFSPDGQQVYWLTDKGELGKTDEMGKTSLLVTVKRDMVETKQATASGYPLLTYLKGRVNNFILSPDGKYVVYNTLDSYVSCCAAPPDIPATIIRIMKNDGTGKVIVKKPLVIARQLEFFDGWLPDSQRILLHYAYTDEPTMGSPLFEVGLNGKNPQVFKALGYTDPGGTDTVAGAVPAFSPGGGKMAYIEGGVEGQGKIWLANIDGTGKQLLQDNKDLTLANLSWSADGNLLFIQNGNLFFVYSSDGKVIFQTKGNEPVQFARIISPDHKYLAGLSFPTGDNRSDELFVQKINTSEKHEFNLVKQGFQSGKSYIYPQFFTDSGRLYYLISPDQLYISSNKAKQIQTQLWVVDTKTWRNFKIADNVTDVDKANITQTLVDVITPSVVPTQDPAAVPLQVTVLKTSYGIESETAPVFPQPLRVVIPSYLANQIAAYGGAANRIVLGPKGWTGDSSEGADGNTFISLYPVGGSVTLGPHIKLEEYPACGGCILEAAAPFFEPAKEEYVRNFPGAPMVEPSGTDIQAISSTLVKYKLTTPTQTTTGLAYYLPQDSNQYRYFLKIEVVLPSQQQSLSDYILADVKSRYNLK